jgi:hypothetical protein
MCLLLTAKGLKDFSFIYKRKVHKSIIMYLYFKNLNKNRLIFNHFQFVRLHKYTIY